MKVLHKRTGSFKVVRSQSDLKNVGHRTRTMESDLMDVVGKADGCSVSRPFRQEESECVMKSTKNTSHVASPLYYGCTKSRRKRTTLNIEVVTSRRSKEPRVVISEEKPEMVSFAESARRLYEYNLAFFGLWNVWSSRDMRRCRRLQNATSKSRKLLLITILVTFQ